MKLSTSTLAAICLTLLALTAAVSAQTAKPAQSSAATNMDILAAKLKADKKLVVAETMGLTDAESKGFWPVYEACQAELNTINSRLKAGIEGYAKDYNAGTVTDARAAALTAEAFAIDEALLANRKACAAKLNGIVPAAKIARYVQIENKIRALVNYELAALIPFVR